MTHTPEFELPTGVSNKKLQEPKVTILSQASKFVDGEREEEYGHPFDDFTRVTRAARALGIDPRSGPLHHALYMVVLKVARLVDNPTHYDSIVDIAGYARTYERCLEKTNADPE